MVVFETHLLHAVHLQVNLDVFGTTSFFLDVHVVCQHQQTKLFFLPNCVLHFSGSCMIFSSISWTRRTFLDFWWVGSYLRMFWKWWWIQPTWIHQWEAECFWCVWNLCDSAATLKTGQVQEDQHSTVHAAWIECLCSESRGLGFCVFV